MKFYCNYVGGTFSYTYVRRSFDDIMQVTVSVESMQLEVSAALMQVIISPLNMWVTIFAEIMQVGVSVAIMK